MLTQNSPTRNRCAPTAWTCCCGWDLGPCASRRNSTSSFWPWHPHIGGGGRVVLIMLFTCFRKNSILTVDLWVMLRKWFLKEVAFFKTVCVRCGSVHIMCLQVSVCMSYVCACTCTEGTIILGLFRPGLSGRVSLWTWNLRFWLAVGKSQWC